MRFFFLLFFIPQLLFAFTKGEGSTFVMSENGTSTDIDIYFASSGKEKVSLEYHMNTPTLVGANVWMQFALEVSEKSGVVIQQGYIQANKDLKAERMERGLFYQNKGVQVQDFIFTKESELKKDFIGEETVEIPAGSIKAKHYQKVNDGQTVDFWISDKVKPIGLVKLVSKSTTLASNNYSIELKALLVNVKPVIDPSTSVPMSNNTKSFLVTQP